MERYDYRQNVKDDVKNYIKENEIHWTEDDRDDVQNDVNEQCWVADSVTGNGSGSYTFNTWQAEENVCHNTELLAEALEEWGQQGENILEKGAEWADVTIRCYLLGECIGTAMDELEAEGWNEGYEPEADDDEAEE
ncbi:MAG: hypothetical protein IKS71_00555 [Bacteroidales bacterium]|nr:hypothetical protein [Bacteroidales bacterium]